MNTPLAELLQKITPLPWLWRRHNEKMFSALKSSQEPQVHKAVAFATITVSESTYIVFKNGADAEYLAHAANTLPALVAAVRKHLAAVGLLKQSPSDYTSLMKAMDGAAAAKSELEAALAAAENVNMKGE